MRKPVAGTATATATAAAVASAGDATKALNRSGSGAQSSTHDSLAHAPAQTGKEDSSSALKVCCMLSISLFSVDISLHDILLGIVDNLGFLNCFGYSIIYAPAVTG